MAWNHSRDYSGQEGDTRDLQQHQLTANLTGFTGSHIQTTAVKENLRREVMLRS